MSQKYFFGSGLTETTTKSKADTLRFKPNPKSYNQRRYDAIVRFVLNPENPMQNIIVRRECNLKNVNTQQTMYLKHGTKTNMTPIQEAFLTLWNTKNEFAKSLAKANMNTTTANYALVYVVVDNVNPNNNGKYLVWSIPKTVAEMIKNVEKNGHQLFHPTEGYAMRVTVTLNNANVSDYSQSAFIEQITEDTYLPITSNGEVIKRISNESEFEELFNFLMSNEVPHIKELEAKDLSEVETTFMNEAIQSNVEAYTRLSGGGGYNQQFQQAPQAQFSQQMPQGFAQPAFPQQQSAFPQQQQVVFAQPTQPAPAPQHIPTPAPAPQAMQSATANSDVMELLNQAKGMATSTPPANTGGINLEEILGTV